MNRALLRAVVVGLVAGSLTSCATRGVGWYVPDHPTPQQSLALLKEGNDRAARGDLWGKKTSPQLRAQLVDGQKPFAVVLACADSRTSPEIIFDQPLGSLFVCRVAGNVTDPEITGSIEYAVEHLHSPLIVVLGHSHCGAVTAALSGEGAPGNLGVLVNRVHPGIGLPQDQNARLNSAIANNTAYQANLLTKTSPVLRKEVHEGKLRIVTGVYSLETGKVDWQ
jgi:carbonic anhydrase